MRDFLFLMDRDFEIGKHKEVVRICAYSECEIVYVAQLGGQKSGSSPAIQIKKVEESPRGFCSIRCLFLANGWSLDPIKEYYRSLGLNYDQIFPIGYLAPARRLSAERFGRDGKGGEL